MKREISFFCFLQCTSAAVPNSRIIASQQLPDGLELELVQVLFRHGARTPTQEELNTYSYLNSSVYEPWGLEALTNQGMRQEYEFGSFLRDRYAGFLDADYKAKSVYAYTSDSDRAKMSLELLLAGLYPPSGDKLWNSELKWSPVPYVYTPHRLDILLRYAESRRFRRLVKRVQRSADYKRKLAVHAQFLDFVEGETGVQFPAERIKNAQNMYGVLASHEHQGLPLPDWYTSAVKARFVSVLETVFDGYSFTPAMRRLGAGPIIRTFVENMNLNGTLANPRKIYLYSAHDGVVAAFARAHAVRQFRYPAFGSGLLLEKLRDRGGRVHVRILSWDGSGNLRRLTVDNCAEFCPIDEYLRILEPVIPSKREIDEMFGEFDVGQLQDLFFKDDAVNPI